MAIKKTSSTTITPRRNSVWRQLQRQAWKTGYRRAYSRRLPMGRSQYNRGRRIARARGMRRSYFTLPKFLIAQIDPFSRSSMHVRVPDDSTAPSSSFYAYDENTLGTTAATTAGWANAMYFYPNAVIVGATATSASASTWTWTASYGGTVAISKAATIQAQYKLCRPVAHGIRITCGLAPTSTTGYVHVGLYSMNLYNASTWSLPTSITDLSELPFYRRLTLAALTQTPLVIANKFLDQTAFRYVATTSDEVFNANRGNFQVCFDFVSGNFR